MGIVKSGRRVGRQVGRVVDAEDRRLLAQAVIYLGGGGVVVVAVAGAAGLAIRVFGLAAG